MANEDTIKLLEECNSGVQMAVFSMEEILEDVKDSDFRKTLIDSISAHRKLGDETHSYLSKCGCEAKDPNPIAKGMSWMKTNTKMLFDDSDKNCADFHAFSSISVSFQIVGICFPTCVDGRFS